jgi:hypothetical protein
MAFPSRYPRPVAPQVTAVFGARPITVAMLASGSALRVRHAWPDAIGRFYRFDAPNCQSGPDLAAIWAADLTTIKAGRGAVCHGAWSLAGCGAIV